MLKLLAAMGLAILIMAGGAIVLVSIIGLISLIGRLLDPTLLVFICPLLAVFIVVSIVCYDYLTRIEENEEDF